MLESHLAVPQDRARPLLGASISVAMRFSYARLRSSVLAFTRTTGCPRPLRQSQPNPGPVATSAGTRHASSGGQPYCTQPTSAGAHQNRDKSCLANYSPLVSTHQVGCGVTVHSDMHLPSGTVAVTRGGVLKGSVIAREFLLEDGKDRVYELQGTVLSL